MRVSDLAWSRRRLLQRAAGSLGHLTLLSALAACAPTSAPPSTSSAPPVASSAPAPAPAPAASSPASPAASPSSVPSAAPGQAGQASLRVAWVAAAQSMPLFLADNLHFFANRGIQVDLQFLTGGVTTDALVAREVDAVMQAAVGVIVGDLNGGLDMVYPASLYNHSEFSLFVQPGITSAADLKGKTIGNDKPGTATDFQTRLLLQQVGLQASDVNILPLGAGGVVAAALLSGQIDAAPLGHQDGTHVQSAGFVPLTNTYNVPYQAQGPTILRQRLEELTPVFIPFLLAARDGMRAFASQPDVGQQIIASALQIDDPALQADLYNFYTNVAPFQMDLRPTSQGIQATLDFLAQTTTPAAASATADQFIDTRILDQLPTT